MCMTCCGIWYGLSRCRNRVAVISVWFPKGYSAQVCTEGPDKAHTGCATAFK
jgi:hypothetical protein